MSEEYGMKRIAVIAEFNPFHTGHAWLLSQVRQQAGPQSLIVVIMSGSFVQRGEPALFDKWHRAAWAVEGGADLVFELPAVYSLSSADGFALGGVWLASRLGCSHLACGVERGTADDFYALARAAQDIRPCRGRETAGRRQTIALAARIREQTASLLDQPNALLAASYAKAIVQQDLSLQFWPILRQGNHHDPSLAHSFASASALRQDIIQTGRCQHLHRYLTPQAREDMAALLSQGAYTDYDRYGDFILFQNRLLTPEMLRQLPAFNEGLDAGFRHVQRGTGCHQDPPLCLQPSVPHGRLYAPFTRPQPHGPVIPARTPVCPAAGLISKGILLYKRNKERAACHHPHHSRRFSFPTGPETAGTGPALHRYAVLLLPWHSGPPVAAGLLSVSPHTLTHFPSNPHVVNVDFF